MKLEMPATFKYEKRGKVAIMTINRPAAMNAFTEEMLAAMDAAFADFQKDKNLWVAIFTGAGDKSFCSGMDLGEAIPKLNAGAPMGYEDHTKRPFSDVFKPIISAVNGFCIAGGMEFMQGTDIRIAAEHATFGLGEVRFGLVPAGGTHVRLPRQIPWAVAMELLLTGENISAQRAYDIGLINKIVPKESLMEEALNLAEKICKNSPLAMQTAKEIVVRQANLEPGFVLEKALAARVFGSHDAQEGPKAFMERREPKFTGK
ncbi:MAG: enoyl-CoA hydratase/isomerase family protein [Pseudomonadales bacterium]|nr:enoyl-CoA hydratase/isomerase family protein [Halioglobus sp.]MCP5194702.1 enoyl-CoA hydratase/isomerase family protein [Pseudomonadales bacterium]